MKAEVLKPQVVRPAVVHTPQCCVEIRETEWLSRSDWRRERYSKLRPHFDPALCQHESVFLLDGKHYCKSHAGIYALEKWMKGELVAKEVENDHNEKTA